MRSPNNVGLLSFDVSSDGHTIATGTILKGEDASIHFWDTRKPAVPIFSHTSTHSDDITSLHFHPTISDRLLSASSDGLLSITNTAEQDEDEAIEHVGNWGCSIAQTGWYHDGVWAASDMETFSLWTSELDKILEPNFKEIPPRVQYSWEPDYLIGCYRSQDRLRPVVGSNSYVSLAKSYGSASRSENISSGSFSFLSSSSSQPWTVDRTYSSHHDGIVRSLLVDDVLRCFITGGEDGVLHLWDLTPSSAPSLPSKSEGKRELDGGREADEMDVDHVQASIIETHHFPPLAHILISRSKSRNGGDFGHVPLLNPGAYSWWLIPSKYEERYIRLEMIKYVNTHMTASKRL